MIGELLPDTSPVVVFSPDFYKRHFGNLCHICYHIFIPNTIAMQQSRIVVVHVIIASICSVGRTTTILFATIILPSLL